MISQFFILSGRGDTIINRDCKLLKRRLYSSVRSDVVKNTPEIFFRKVKLYTGDAPPIFVRLFA
jgi:AP-4 complex subunit mu-1